MAEIYITEEQRAKCRKVADIVSGRVADLEILD